MHILRCLSDGHHCCLAAWRCSMQHTFFPTKWSSCWMSCKLVRAACRTWVCCSLAAQVAQPKKRKNAKTATCCANHCLMIGDLTCLAVNHWLRIAKVRWLLDESPPHGWTCLELAWQHRSSSFSKDFGKGNGRRWKVVFSIKVWCLVLGRTCLELAWQHRSSSFSKDFRKGNGRRWSSF